MLLHLPFILETRRNHALEHATLHVLAAKFPERHMAGHSNPSGFFILGNFSTEEVTLAVHQALARLRSGERQLAIHPGCGTNLATSVLLSGAMAWLPLRHSRSRWSRWGLLPLALALALLGLVVSQPLGPVLQAKVTTEAEMGDLQIVEVRPVFGGRYPAHYVFTRN
jgi:hypothetical protein